MAISSLTLPPSFPCAQTHAADTTRAVGERADRRSGVHSQLLFFLSVWPEGREAPFSAGVMGARGSLRSSANGRGSCSLGYPYALFLPRISPDPNCRATVVRITYISSPLLISSLFHYCSRLNTYIYIYMREASIVLSASGTISIVRFFKWFSENSWKYFL